jgi:hypothetical protein
MTIDLDELEAKARAATPGEFQDAGFEEDNDLHWIAAVGGNPSYPREAQALGGYFRGEDQAFALAANPAVVLELVRELRQLRAATAGAPFPRCPVCRCVAALDAGGLVVEHHFRGERCGGSGSDPVRT